MSEVTVTFWPDGDSTLLRFEHGGWNAENASYRSKFGDWPLILDGYVAVADGDAADHRAQG